MAEYDLHKRAAAIVRDAGGQLVGRTRLQKVAYLAQLAGFSGEFPFEYRHYGPYSEELSQAMEIASGLKLIREEERETAWGGWYSIYTLQDNTTLDTEEDNARHEFISSAANIGAIELELAATAAFLYEQGIVKDRDGDPWEATKKLKPEKADDGRLAKAKSAYNQLRRLPSPRSLPDIA